MGMSEAFSSFGKGSKPDGIIPNKNLTTATPLFVRNIMSVEIHWGWDQWEAFSETECKEEKDLFLSR